VLSDDYYKIKVISLTNM